MLCLRCKEFRKSKSKDYMGRCKKFGCGIAKNSLGIDGCNDGEEKIKHKLK